MIPCLRLPPPPGPLPGLYRARQIETLELAAAVYNSHDAEGLGELEVPEVMELLLDFGVEVKGEQDCKQKMRMVRPLDCFEAYVFNIATPASFFCACCVVLCCVVLCCVVLCCVVLCCVVVCCGVL